MSLSSTTTAEPMKMDATLLQARIAQFQPEPLVPLDDDVDVVQSQLENLEIPAVYDENDIDMAKANYLDVLNSEEIKKTSEDIIRKYGVGTCGPRAFYGTTDVHLELEEALAKFLGMEESIIYSYGFVAISSSIAAYCKKNDLVFIDEHANFPTDQGLLAAKSRVIRFNHNDPQSLKEELEKVVYSQKKRNSRKFLILEGINWKTGSLCPLPEFLAVAEQFKMRIFLDETFTIGVLGRSGRGLTEHYGIDPSRLDMIIGTLEGPIGSIGGFCAGSNMTIEHQRLSGSGYIFSASLPTYLVKAVVRSLELMGDKPGKLVDLAVGFHKSLEDIGYDVRSHPKCPFKLFGSSKRKNSEIYEKCKQEGLHLILRDDGMLMANMNVGFSDEKLRRALDTLKNAL